MKMDNSHTIMLKPADIFFTRGKGFISRGIRFFTRGFGERRTEVNHVGVVVEEGTLRTAVVVEALSHVKEHRLWKRYAPRKNDSVAIYRANNLSPEEIETIVTAAKGYVGRKYGYHMVVAHVLDWFLLGAYVFRRLAAMDKYPVCSWVVAFSFLKADKHFNVEPGAAQPDDIWNFIHDNPQIYEEIYPLKPLA
jgi:hypothetical protein